MQGLTICTPTSISYTGTNAVINDDGSVSFTATSDLGIDGVFSATYNDYLILYRAVWNTTISTVAQMTMRAGGVNDTSGTWYQPYWGAYGSSLEASANDGLTAVYPGIVANVQQNGSAIYLLGPYETNGTSYFSTATIGQDGARIRDYAGNQNSATSWDGFRFRPGANSFTGKITVYGFTK